MSTHKTGKSSRLSSGQILKLVLGMVVIGVLMGFCTEFEHRWQRVLVAGCAGAALGWTLIQAQKRNDKL